MIYKDVLLAFSSLIFVLLLTGFFYYLSKSRKKSTIVFWASSTIYNSVYVNFLRTVYYLIFAFSILFMLIALSRPQEKTVVAKSKKKGVDILFVLDVSDSMLIEDMEPLENRLESAKYHIKEFIKNRTHDRMGLVVFSGEAYTRVPLTTDYGLLLKNLKALEVSDTMKKGTAIGVALAAGVNRLRESKVKSKILVLLTDGENNTGVIDPLTALDLAVGEGIKSYTLGIGRDGQSMLPVFRKDRYGRKIKSYRPFPTKINEELLRKISYETGGQFYRASDEQDMSRIFNEIDNLEKSVVKTPKVFKMVEHFQFYLLASISLLFLFFLFEISFLWRGY